MDERYNKLTPEDIRSVDIDGVDKVELMVRNINGEGVLFTRDGKMIGHQIPSAGHYYYVGHGKERRKMFRATFIVDNMPSDVP